MKRNYVVALAVMVSLCGMGYAQAADRGGSNYRGGGYNAQQGGDSDGTYDQDWQVRMQKMVEQFKKEGLSEEQIEENMKNFKEIMEQQRVISKTRGKNAQERVKALGEQYKKEGLSDEEIKSKMAVIREQVQKQEEERNAWREDFQTRRRAAVKQYKQQGLSPEEIGEKLADFDRERKEHLRSMDAKLREIFKDLKSDNKSRIEPRGNDEPNEGE